MAERLTMKLMVLAVVAAACPFARAQGALADPTRPPAASAGVATASSATAGGARLQSVLISDARKLAVIDGVTVPLGGQVGSATLVDIQETQVTLRRGAETQTLRLHPRVERRATQVSASEETKKGTSP
jgi:MSHA biogenesis protein MshK